MFIFHEIISFFFFSRKSDVKAHILRVHVNARRYPCTFCDKKFKESTHLTKHLRTHTGERPYYCDSCEKGFQTGSDLRRHKKTRVHLENTFSFFNTEKVDTTDNDIEEVENPEDEFDEMNQDDVEILPEKPKAETSPNQKWTKKIVPNVSKNWKSA